MQIYPVIRGVVKTFLTFVTIAVLLTSLIGGVSIFRVLGNENNFRVNQGEVEMNFGAAGNRFLIEMNLNNTGYFDFHNFSVDVQCQFNNKSSSLNYTILDATLFQDTLSSQTQNEIRLEANNTDFNPIPLLADNNNSWHDPDVQTLIDNGTLTEAQAEELSFPYLLWNYNVIYHLQVQSDYNLKLITFNVGIEFVLTYAQYFTQSYPDLKASVMATYGL